jgi:uncharacterized protein YndB with AHSA1/START domain
MADENRGCVTTREAADLGVPTVELRKLAGRGALLHVRRDWQPTAPGRRPASTSRSLSRDPEHGGADTVTDRVARVETVIDASPERVWQAITDPEQVRQYMAGAQVDSGWQQGDPITWSGEWNGRPFQDKGKILAIDPGKQLRVSHYSALSGQPDVPESYHVVTYDLTREGDRTRLLLTQENNSDEAMVAESEKTWSMMLDGLKKVAEQG